MANRTPRDPNFEPAIQGVDSSSGLAQYLTSLSLGGATVFPLTVALVDGSGTQITTFGGTSLADNAAFTAGTTTGTPAMGFYHSTIDSVTDGHAAALAIDSKRNLFTVIRDAADNARGVNVTASNELLVNVNNASIAVTGTFWQATQPVSGTVTANAGTNLNTSALAVESGGNLATIGGAIIAQEATTSGIKGITVFGAVTTNAPTYTTLKSDALSLDTSGLLRISLKDTPANTNKFLVTADAITIAAAQTLATVTTVSTVSAARIVGNAGATLDAAIGAGTAPTNMVAVGGQYNSTEIGPTNTQSAALQLDSKGRLRMVVMDAAANTRGQNVNANNAAGVYIDQTTIGTTNGVTPVPSKAGGTGWQYKQFGDGTVGTDWNGTKQQIVGTAATFGGYVMIFNPNTATSFIQVFNKTSANVTLGTTVPDMVIPIPGVASASATGAAANNELVQGVPFATALTVAITTTVGGLTAPSNKCYGCILYN